MAVEQKKPYPATRFQNFIAHIKNTPLARTERFECTFALPPSLNETINAMDDPAAHNIIIPKAPGGSIIKEEQTYFMSMMCEEVQIPGMVLQNKEVSIGTWQFMRNSNVAFLGNEINFTFLTDVEWKLRHVFEAWIGHCVNPQSKKVAFPDDQFGQVWINLLDMEDKVQTTWLMHEVTPKVLNLVPLATGATSFARTTLIISSAYWESKTVAIDLNEECGATGPGGGYDANKMAGRQGDYDYPNPNRGTA